MITTTFDYESPATLAEAISLLSRDDAKILAGGHSLLPAMKLRLAAPGLLVDLGGIAGLSYIREAKSVVSIGAMTTHAEIASSGLLAQSCRLLAETASHIGDTQVRNRGTVGGSIAHADPAADYPAALLALNAEIVVNNGHGERLIPVRDFFTGLFSTSLGTTEIITEIRVPSTQGAKTAYLKFAHPASGFAVVGVAAVVHAKGEQIERAAIGITGVGQNAYRAASVEERLVKRPQSAIADAARHATDGIDVLGDHFAPADYRTHLAQVYTRRAIETALSR